MTPPSEPPLCECHGVAMVWHHETRLRLGGRWRCHVEKRASARRVAAKRYKMRRKLGLCVECGSDSRGSVFCAGCREARRRSQRVSGMDGERLVKRRARSRRANHVRYDKAVVNGMCVYCGIEPASSGRICEHCKSKKRLHELTRVRIRL